MLFANEDEWKEAARRAFEETPPGGIHVADARLPRDGSTFICCTRGRRIDAGDAEQEWIWSYEDVTAEREADRRVQQALARRSSARSPSAPPSWRRRRRAPSTSPTTTRSPGCPTGACWRTA